MTEALQELGTQIAAKRPDCVLSWDVAHGELNVDVAPANIAGLVEFLKSDSSCKFSSLVDITAVDYPERGKRFDVVYHLLSMYQNQRIRLRELISYYFHKERRRGNSRRLTKQTLKILVNIDQSDPVRCPASSLPARLALVKEGTNSL